MGPNVLAHFRSQRHKMGKHMRKPDNRQARRAHERKEARQAEAIAAKVPSPNVEDASSRSGAFKLNVFTVAGLA